MTREAPAGTAFAQMPQYQCHKKVWALKIECIHWLDDIGGRANLEFSDKRYAPREFSAEFMAKHKPHGGGYLVVYEDGYESFSPQQAFESGYTLIG